MKPISDTVSVSQQATSRLLSLASPVAAGVLPAAILMTFAAPFFVLMFYSIPAYDDFCKAALVEFNGVPQPGVVALAWTHYIHSSPRWLTTFIQGVVMSKVDLFGAYGWLLLAVVGITVASLWYFVHTFLEASPKRSLLITALFYTAWMASIRTPAEALFWVTGATEYYLPLSALLVLVSLLHSFRGATWQYLVVAFLSFAIPALHEIAGTLLCAIALAGLICTRLKKAPSSPWAVALAASTLGMALFILSPGNAERAALEHRHSWDFAHAPYWIAHSFYHGLTWLWTPAVLAAAFYIFLVSHRQEGTEAAKGRPPQWLGPASLCFMLFTLCECSLVEIAGGTAIYGRVINWFQFVYWLLFVCAASTGMRWIRGAFPTATKSGAFILVAVILLGSWNYRSVIEDLHGPAQSWRRSYAQVDLHGPARPSRRSYATQFASRGGELTFPAVTRFPKMAVRQGVTEDPGCWTNKCVARFLGAKSVVVPGSLEQCNLPVPKEQDEGAPR
jgi:hypothetical protein